MSMDAYDGVKNVNVGEGVKRMGKCGLSARLCSVVGHSDTDRCVQHECKKGKE